MFTRFMKLIDQINADLINSDLQNPQDLEKVTALGTDLFQAHDAILQILDQIKNDLRVYANQQVRNSEQRSGKLELPNGCVVTVPQEDSWVKIDPEDVVDLLKDLGLDQASQLFKIHLIPKYPVIQGQEKLPDPLTSRLRRTTPISRVSFQTK